MSTKLGASQALKDVENSKKNNDMVDGMSDADVLDELYRDDKDPPALGCLISK